MQKLKLYLKMILEKYILNLNSSFIIVPLVLYFKEIELYLYLKYPFPF